VKKVILNYGWVILGVCLSIGIISVAIRMSFGVFFKSIESYFDLNRAATSGVMSISQIVGCGACLIGGWALDRYGPKKIFLTASVLACVGLILTSLVTSTWQLYLTYGLILSSGTGSVNTLMNATTSRWFLHKRGMILGVLGSANSLGLIVGAPIISSLIINYNWQRAFLVLGIVVLLIWIPGSLLLKRAREIDVRNQKEESSASAGSFSIFQTMKSAKFWIFASIAALHAFNVIIVMTHVVPFAIDTGLSPGQAASILIIIGFVSLVSRIIIGRFADKGSRKSSILFATLFQGTGIILLIWAANIWWFIAFAIIWGIGYGSVSPPWYLLIADTFGMRHLGVTIGALDMAFGFGAALGPVIAGYLFDVRGDYTLVFIICLTLIVISLWPVLSIKSSVAKD
jgi:MFS family permease